MIGVQTTDRLLQCLIELVNTVSDWIMDHYESNNVSLSISSEARPDSFMVQAIITS